jgi:hypothetical protein
MHNQQIYTWDFHGAEGNPEATIVKYRAQYRAAYLHGNNYFRAMPMARRDGGAHRARVSTRGGGRTIPKVSEGDGLSR